MADLNFQQLDEQIYLMRRRFEQFQKERENWREEREDLEKKLHALEEEVGRLSEFERKGSSIVNENKQYRKSQEIVREQVVKMLDRIDTFAQS